MRAVPRIFSALAASIILHLVLAAGLVAYLAFVPAPDAAATLDLSSVELSFAEKAEESAAVAPVMPSPPPERLRPKAVEKPPAPVVEKFQAPDPLAPEFPEPKEAPEKMEPVSPKNQQDQPMESDAPVTPNNQTISPPPAAAPRQARVDAPPSPVRTIRPDYPKGARRRGEQGAVVLEIRVDAEGSVGETRVVVSSGFAELDEAAVRAAKKAKFRPAKSGDRTVASTARLKLDFKLK